MRAEVEIGAVQALERELADARKRIATALRETRRARGLSLRDVAPKVKLSPVGLLDIENGESWKTKTVARVLRFYERTATPQEQQVA